MFGIGTDDLTAPISLFLGGLGMGAGAILGLVCCVLTTRRDPNPRIYALKGAALFGSLGFAVGIGFNKAFPMNFHQQECSNTPSYKQ